MKVAVVGAGPAGLNALKYCINEGFSCDVFEKSGLIGGLWNYTEKTGLNEFGIPLHTTTYEGLKTNLPKELMQFENFPHTGNLNSYLSQAEILRYIHEYADKFNLRPHIQFYKLVEEIDVLPKNRWNITIRDLKSSKQERETKEYDAVVVCPGHFSKPYIPQFKGAEIFTGSMDHSINYRKSDPYTNRKVLVIGSRPSGLDISRLVSKVADQVILSHKSPMHPASKFPKNIKLKPEVEEFKANSVLFKDGTEETITDVVFCTGYTKHLPFLSKKCEIEIEDNHTLYLYKQIINAKHPTMAFLGMPYVTYVFTLFGIQMRFFLAYLKGQFIVSEEDMIQDAINFIKSRQEEGLNYNSLPKVGKDYYDDLSTVANIKNVPGVLEKMYYHVLNEGREKFEECFQIVNDEEFKIV